MPVVTCPNCGAKNRIPDEAPARARPVCGRCKSALPSATDAVHPVVVTDASFGRVVLEAGSTPVLLDCWAAWCGPCRMLAPTLDQLAAESGGKYIVAKLNTDENPAVASRLGIEALPTLLVFKNGQVVDKIVGLAPKQTIARKLEAYV